MSFFKSLFSAIEQNISNRIFESGISTSNGIDESEATTGGDIDIKSITLMSADMSRSKSIFPQVKAIHIYESIFQPVTTAILEMEDTINLHSEYPILGKEFLAIKIKTPGADSSSKYLFRVKRISERVRMENNKGVRYTLVCYSPEYVRGISSLVQDAPEQEAHKTVKDILTNTIQTTKRIRADVTKGIPPKQLSNLPPLVAIDLLRSEAKSTNTNALGGAWFFFENADGFNFTTLDKLYERGLKKQKMGSDKVFFYDAASNLSPLGVNIRNILMYKQVSFVDDMDAQYEGAHRASYLGFDLTRGVGQMFDFRASNFKTPAGLTGTTQSRVANERSTAVTEVIPFRSEVNSTDEDAEAIAKRRAFTQQMAQNITHVTIYGDTNITVGDVVKCNITEAKDSTSPSNLDRFSSGNYLVTKIKHSIQVSDRSIHVMSMELVKGSIIEEVK